MGVFDSYCGFVENQNSYGWTIITFHITSNHINYDISIMITRDRVSYFFNGKKSETLDDLMDVVNKSMYENPTYTCGPLIIEENYSSKLPEIFWVWFLNQNHISMSLI